MYLKYLHVFFVGFLQYKGEDNVFEVSFILCSIYLLLGMALIAMCFNLMQVIFTLLNFMFNIHISHIYWL